MRSLDELIEQKVKAPEVNVDKVKAPETKKEKPKTPKAIQDILDPPGISVDVPDAPPKYNIENTIFINGIPVEIKPTELLYFRNGMTDSFGYLRAIPLNELLRLPVGALDKTYSGDELVYRFLYAVFNGNSLLKKHYNDLTSEDIEKIINIFGRLNGIFKREEEAKSKKAEQQTKIQS